MRRLSITARVALLCTLITAAIAALALTALMLGEERMLADYYRDTMLSAAQLARDDIIWEDGQLKIDRNLDDMPDIKPAVYSADGDLLYGRSDIDADFVQGIRRIEQADDEWYVFDQLIESGAGESVWLRLYMSSGAAAHLDGVCTRLMLIIFPALVALAGLGGCIVARGAMRPVAKITSAAESIADGTDLKKRIAISGAHDELYRLAEVFDGMLERLDGAFERERRFTSDVSHELRTPVTVILAQSGYALSGSADDNDRTEALREIDTRARAMGDLIRKLLVLSRMDARQLEPEFESADMALIAEAAAESFYDAAEARGMNIRLNAGCGAVVRGDQTMLAQAVMNLVENAVRYGREGGNIDVYVTEAGGEVRVQVKDDGPGMTEAQAAQAFERFYRADKSRSSNGTGLGLSLALRIAQLHSGRIELVTAPDEGAEFTLVIPKNGG